MEINLRRRNLNVEFDILTNFNNNETNRIGMLLVNNNVYSFQVARGDKEVQLLKDGDHVYSRSFSYQVNLRKPGNLFDTLLPEQYWTRNYDYSKRYERILDQMRAPQEVYDRRISDELNYGIITDEELIEKIKKNKRCKILNQKKHLELAYLRFEYRGLRIFNDNLEEEILCEEEFERIKLKVKELFTKTVDFRERLRKEQSSILLRDLKEEQFIK